MTIEYENCIPQGDRQRIRLRSTDKSEVERAMRLPGCVCGWGTVANGTQAMTRASFAPGGVEIEIETYNETVYNVMQLVSDYCSLHASVKMYPVEKTVMK